MATGLAPELAKLAELAKHLQQAIALAPTDPESGHAARHLAHAIGLGLKKVAKVHRVLLAAVPDPCLSVVVCSQPAANGKPTANGSTQHRSPMGCDAVSA